MPSPSPFYIVQTMASASSRISSFATKASKEYDIHLLPWAFVVACIFYDLSDGDGPKGVMSSQALRLLDPWQNFYCLESSDKLHMGYSPISELVRESQDNNSQLLTSTGRGEIIITDIETLRGEQTRTSSPNWWAKSDLEEFVLLVETYSCSNKE